MNKLAHVLVAGGGALGILSLFGCMPDAATEGDDAPETDVVVHVTELKIATLRDYVVAYGAVEPEPAGAARGAANASVAPAVPGVVVTVSCAEGQHVQKGDVLFELDSRAADVAVDFAERTLERQRRLMEIEGTSEGALQNAEQQLDAARVQQELLRVRAPLTGTVTRVNITPGQAVDLTTRLAEIVDLDRLVVSAGVPSAELAPLEVGQSAEVLAEPGSSPVHATLAYISSDVDAQTGTARVRAALPPGSGLRPGQFVSLRIVSQERRDRLVAPIDSVVRDEAGQSVIAVVENGIAARKPVRTGLRDGGLVEVEADGLRAGMQVVTEGAYALPERTKVTIAED